MNWREMSGVMVYNPRADSYRVNGPPAEGAFAQFDLKEYKVSRTDVLISLITNCGTRDCLIDRIKCTDEKSAKEKAYGDARKFGLELSQHYGVRYSENIRK